MLPKHIEQLLQDIATDMESGAALLFQKGVGTADVLSKEQLSPDQLKHALQELGDRLMQTKPMMAPLVHLRQELKDIPDLPQLQALIQRYQDPTPYDQMINRAIRLLKNGETILTHSHSSTIQSVIESAHEKGLELHIIVTESEPGGEGKTLATQLQQKGISTQLIPDDAVAEFLPTCQKFLVGADAVTPTFFVNKVGTRKIAQAAQAIGCKVLVIADKTKHIDTIPLSNDLFEKIPLSLVTHLIS